MANARVDDNSNPSLLALSDADSSTPVALEADPTTKRLKVNATITGSLTTSAGTATLTDDSAFQVGTAAVTPAGGVYKSTRDTIDDGDVGAVAINANRAQLIVLETPNGDSAMDDTNDAVRVNLVAGSSSGIQYTDGASLGANVGTGTLVFGRATSGDAVHALSVDTDGALYVNLASNPTLATGGNTIGTATIRFGSGVSLPSGSNVLGTATINDGGGSITVDATNLSTNVAQMNGVAVTMGNGASGTGVQRVTIANDSTGVVGLSAGVNVIGTASIRFSGGVSLPAGTNNIGDVDVLTLPALTAGSNTIGTATITGNIAHDTVDGGNPVKTGARATATLSTVTLVASGDRVDNMSDLDGALIIRPYGPLGDNVIGTAQITTNISTQVMAAGASGIKNHITDVIIANAGGTAVVVELLDGTATRTWFPAPSGSAGVVHAFTFPLKGSAATAWNVKSSGTTTLFVTLNGFKSKI